jgi:hypothetical protein
MSGRDGTLLDLSHYLGPLITLVRPSVWSMIEGVRLAGRQQFALLVGLGVLTHRYEADCD